jgi:hypothetical protein
VVKLRRKLTAFLVTFCAEEKSDWHVGPPPTVLIEKYNKKEKSKFQDNSSVANQKSPWLSAPDDLELELELELELDLKIKLKIKT